MCIEIVKSMTSKEFTGNCSVLDAFLGISFVLIHLTSDHDQIDSRTHEAIHAPNIILTFC